MIANIIKVPGCVNSGKKLVVHSLIAEEVLGIVNFITVLVSFYDY
jgi:hypothetical protein